MRFPFRWCFVDKCKVSPKEDATIPEKRTSQFREWLSSKEDSFPCSCSGPFRWAEKSSSARALLYVLRPRVCVLEGSEVVKRFKGGKMKTKYSDAERAEWKDKMNVLVGKVGSMSKSEREFIASKYPLITPEGHALSAYNVAFLFMQSGREDLTIVGGFRQFERSGRLVNKGEHAVGYIYVPMVGKEKEAQSSEDPSPVRFRLVPVFDVSQTSAADGAVNAVIAGVLEGSQVVKV